MGSGTVKVKQYRLRNRETGIVFGFNALMSQEPQMLLIEVELDATPEEAARYEETRQRQDKELADIAAINSPPLSDQASLIQAIEDRVRAELEKKFSTVQFLPEAVERPVPPQLQDDGPVPPSLEPELHGPPDPRRRKGKGLNTDLTAE